jgi:hypothetical protein
MLSLSNATEPQHDYQTPGELADAAAARADAETTLEMAVSETYNHASTVQAVQAESHVVKSSPPAVVEALETRAAGCSEGEETATDHHASKAQAF